jgi:hypothetical protein
MSSIRWRAAASFSRCSVVAAITSFSFLQASAFFDLFGIAETALELEIGGVATLLAGSLNRVLFGSLVGLCSGISPGSLNRITLELLGFAPWLLEKVSLGTLNRLLSGLSLGLLDRVEYDGLFDNLSCGLLDGSTLWLIGLSPGVLDWVLLGERNGGLFNLSPGGLSLGLLDRVESRSLDKLLDDLALNLLDRDTLRLDVLLPRLSNRITPGLLGRVSLGLLDGVMPGSYDGGRRFCWLIKIAMAGREFLFPRQDTVTLNARWACDCGQIPMDNEWGLVVVRMANSVRRRIKMSSIMMFGGVLRWSLVEFSGGEWYWFESISKILHVCCKNQRVLCLYFWYFFVSWVLCVTLA